MTSIWRSAALSMTVVALVATAGPPLSAAAQQGFVDIVATHEGASDQVRLLRDTTSPRIRITSPLDDSVIAGNAVTVSGTAADLLSTLPPEPTPLFGEVSWSVRDESFVTIGSGSVPVVEGRFTIPDIVLGTGRHSIVVEGLDSARTEGDAFLSILSDPDAPPVALVGLADGEAVLTSSVAVDLNFAAPTTLVSVNGVADGRSFPAGLAPGALTLPLAVGPNAVVLELDAGGDPFLFSFTIFRVESADPVRILAPADGSLTNQVETTVTGTVPRGVPLVTVNGEPATLEPDGVTFTAPVALAEGRNEIRAQAFPLGQEDSVEVGLDTLPPTLELLFPEDGTLTGEAEVAFAGFVSEAGGVEAVGPGGVVSASTQTRVLATGGTALGVEPILEFVFELPRLALVDGLNAIDLRLVDRAGNETLVPVTLRRSSAAVVLESPAAGSILPDLRTDLVLQVLEDVTLEALFSAGRRVPGFEGLALAAGAAPPATATLSGVPLAPGTTELRLIFRRDATGEREVLSFALESLATQVATVAGTVTDAQTGAPLEGALVSVVVDGLELVVPSGPDGRFAVPVEPGDVQVVVHREGFVDLVVEGMPGAGETFVADASLIPWSVGGSPAPADPSAELTSVVAGTVTELATGMPLEGALVVVTQGAFQHSAITEAAGTYAIGGIPVGDFEITITRVGFFPQVFTVEALEPVVAPLDVALEPIPETVTLVGQVRSGISGLPEADVELRVLGTELSARTDANGEFVLESVPLGAQTVRLTKVGFLDAFFTFDDLQPQPGGAPLERNFTYPTERGEGGGLVVPPDLEGSVRDLFGVQPLAGAEVTVEGTAVVADAQGRFSLSLSPLQSFELTASAPGHESQTLHVFVVVNGEDEVDFRLRPTARGFVSGRVTDQTSGAPLLLADVQVEGSPLLATATEGDGSYALVGVPPGSLALRVDHPAYLPATVPVVVADQEETVADVSLVPRPVTGGLEGILRDGQTGSPVQGALVAAPGGATSTTGGDGAYQLLGLRAGLVTLSITAPGFPVAARTTGVVADRDASTPSLTRADFELFADGSTPDEATEDIAAASGGVVQIPDTRFAVVFPPESLSADARVTVRAPAVPRAPPGSTLSLDPALGTEPIVAVGEEVELLIASQVEGDPPPEVVGPVSLLLRYAAAEAAAASVDEDALFPYFFDGTQWTALHTLPYAHAVDRINKVVIVGLSFAKTETGLPVTASLTTDPPLLLAQAGGGVPPFDVVRQFVFHLGAAVQDLLAPRPIAKVVDLIDRFPDINPNALPLLVVHGWDWRTLFQGDIDIIPDPLGASGRYGQMIRDLVAGTDGVYRPVFLTYNSRMSIVQSGNVLARRVSGELLDGSIQGLPSPDDPASGEFSSLTSFGFSMGGLVERTFQCWSGRTLDMVSMGTPHHGALQRFVDGVELALQVAALRYPILAFVDARTVLRHWSPGTADLLDYEDRTGAGNPVLFGVNERSPCSAPQRDIGLIAGDDSLGLLGFLTVGESPNDAVVPARSAHGRSKPGRTIAALRQHVAGRFTERFNHFEGGSASQSIRAFADQDIFPVLTDWTVSRVERFDVTPPQPPDQEGSIEAEVSFAFNVPHGDTTGLALVLYFKDGNGDWRVVAGADPETLQAQDVAPISGNSIGRDLDNLEVKAPIPIPDPDDPATQVVDMRLLVHRISNESSTVPPEPQAEFGLP